MTVRFPIRVQLALDADLSADPSTWPTPEDISTRCYVREGGIELQRGRTDWQVNAQPGWLTALLNNRDGRFSRLNPLGAYFGRLRRNVPIIVAVDPGTGYVTRGTAFLSDLPVAWDKGGNDYWVRVRADDALRRVSQAPPPRSKVTRTWTTADALGSITAFWPCEEGPGADVAADVLGGPPLRPFGGVRFGEVAPPVGLAAAPGLSGARMIADITRRSDNYVPMIAAGNNPTASVQFAAVVDAVGVKPFELYTYANGLGYQILVSSTTVTLIRGDTFATVCTVTVAVADGAWHSYAVSTTPTGTDLLVTLSVDLSSDTQVITGKGHAPIQRVVANPFFSTDVASVAAVVVSDILALSAAEALLAGFPGQEAAARYGELCASAGVAYDYTGNGEEVTLGFNMGADRPTTVLAGLQECEAAVEGVIYSRTDGVLFLQTATDRENLAVTLALDYTQRHLADMAAPADDDRLTANYVTVTMPDGSFGVAQDTSSPMGTDSSTGVGRYDRTFSRNVQYARDAYDHAGWLVNLGTVNAYRWPSIVLKMHSPAVAALTADILAVDIGSRVTIANLPSNLPPDLADLVVEGIRDRFDNYSWDIELFCQPYKPYKVFEIGDTDPDANPFRGHLTGDPASAIRVAIDDNDTSIEIDPNRFRWSTVAADFDPHLRVRFGGETADVSAITTTPGTFVAAGTGVGADNAAVVPGLPAGVTTRDLLLVFAATRGTGTLTCSENYTRLPVFAATDNVALFGKVHTGSEVAPTVTPSDGAAGDTVTAQSAAFRGTPSTLTDLADIVVDSLAQLNGSGQDIAYPGLYPRYQEGCIVLALGWKQDDWTSVATLSGFTEIGDVPSTPGNDQGLVWDYRIQTTPAVVNGGTFTVTGGSAAISRGAVVALAAGYQTLTVSARNVNIIPDGKSHAAATRIEVEDAHVLGL